MVQQIVRPAGAERETLMVVLAAALILAAAFAWVGLRPAGPVAAGLAAHQIDARTGLNAAEQGLLADLRLVAEELGGRAGIPPEQLAAEGLPPFVTDTSWRARGSHAWTLRDGAYVGVSGDPSIAGSMLLLVDEHGPEIWVGHSVPVPAELGQASLAAAGWKQAVSTFEAGVTR
jgi:hypothetical protein